MKKERSCGAVVYKREYDRTLFLLERMVQGHISLPKGHMEAGETEEETARREIREETALELGKLRLIGVYSGPDALCSAPNGDEWYVVNVAYACDEPLGQARVNDGESAALAWFLPEDIPQTLVRSHKEILADYLKMG